MKILKVLIWIIAIAVSLFLLARFILKPENIKATINSAPIDTKLIIPPVPPGHPRLGTNGAILPRITNAHFLADLRTTEEFTPYGYFRPTNR